MAGGGSAVSTSATHIGEVAAGPAVGGIEDDRRCVEQAEIAVQPGDRRLDDAGGPAVAAVRPVRSDRNRIEVRCFVQAQAPR